MLKRSVVGILALATAFTMLGAKATVAQHLVYQYVYYQPPNPPQTAVRYPTRSNTGAFVSFGSCSGDSGMIGVGPFKPPLAPYSNGCATDSKVYTLAFATVTGGADGPVIAFANAQGNLPPANATVQVQPNTDIVVRFVYFAASSLPGGSCQKAPCPSGAVIDEYIENPGQFGSDLFVHVIAQPQSMFMPQILGYGSDSNNSGNINGYVDTTTATVLIQSYPNVPGGNLTLPPASPNTLEGTFDRWLLAGPTTGSGSTVNPQSPQNLIVNKGANVYALAVYHAPCPGGYSWVAGTLHQCVKQTKSPSVGVSGECVGGSAVCNCGKNGFPACPPARSDK